MGLIGLIGAGALPEPNSWQGMAWVALAIGGLALAFNQVHEFWQRIKDKPAPAEVAQEARDRYASKTECLSRHQVVDRQLAELQSRVEAQRQEFEGKLEEGRAQAEESRARLYAHIDQKIAEVQANVARVHERVDNLPSQVVTLLKNTRAIR